MANLNVSDFNIRLPLTDTELRASAIPVSDAGKATEATQARRLGGGKTPATTTANTAGATSIATPPTGQRIRLYWISAIADPQASSSPLITISLGATELYRAYAVSHWEVFEGAPDAALTITLSAGGVNVPVTAHLEYF